MQRERRVMMRDEAWTFARGSFRDLSQLGLIVNKCGRPSISTLVTRSNAFLPDQ